MDMSGVDTSQAALGAGFAGAQATGTIADTKITGLPRSTGIGNSPGIVNGVAGIMEVPADVPEIDIILTRCSSIAELSKEGERKLN